MDQASPTHRAIQGTPHNSTLRDRESDARRAAEARYPSEAGPHDAHAALLVEMGDGEAPDTEFVEALLAALTDMAVRSPRRQADLGVALRRSGIDATPQAMLQALNLLEQDGCIEHLVPLTDGGLLMQVTAHGIERLSQTSRRHVLDFGGR